MLAGNQSLSGQWRRHHRVAPRDAAPPVAEEPAAAGAAGGSASNHRSRAPGDRAAGLCIVQLLRVQRLCRERPAGSASGPPPPAEATSTACIRRALRPAGTRCCRWYWSPVALAWEPSCLRRSWVWSRSTMRSRSPTRSRSRTGSWRTSCSWPASTRSASSRVVWRSRSSRRSGCSHSRCSSS